MNHSRLPTLLILLGSGLLTLFFGWMLLEALHNDREAFARDLAFQSQEQGITVKATRAGFERRTQTIASTLAADPLAGSLLDRALSIEAPAERAALREQLRENLAPYWQAVRAGGALELNLFLRRDDGIVPFLSLEPPGALEEPRHDGSRLLRESVQRQRSQHGIEYDGERATTAGVAPIFGPGDEEGEERIVGLLEVEMGLLPDVESLATRLQSGVALLSRDPGLTDETRWQIDQASQARVENWLSTLAALSREPERDRLEMREDGTDHSDSAHGSTTAEMHSRHAVVEGDEGRHYLLTLIPFVSAELSGSPPVAAVAIWSDITAQLAARDGMIVNTWLRWGLAWLIAEACLLLLLWGTRRVTRANMLAHQQRLETQKRTLESLNQRLAMQKDTLQTLNDIAALQETSFQRLVESALQAGAAHLDIPFAVANRIEGEDYLIEAAYSPDQRFEAGQHLATSDTFCELTMASDDVVAFDDADKDGLGEHRCRLRYALRSYIGAPIWVHGQRYGALAFSSDRPRGRAFDEVDREFVRLLARWIGATLMRWKESRAREELNRRLTKIASQTPGLIYQYREDAEGNPSFPYASDAIETFYGITPQEAAKSAMPVFDLVFKEDLDALSASIRESRVNLTPWHAEYRVRKADGGFIWLAGQSVPERELDGGTLWHGFLHDVTERKRNERLKGEFISTVSHELRTPLTSISGSLGLIQGGALGQPPEAMRSMLSVAHNNAQRLILLINDLLDMEKLVAGKMNFEMEAQPLMPLIEQAIESNQAYADQFNVLYAMTARMDEAQVTVDAMRLQQVMSNLLSNAAKFSPAEAQVEVRVEPVGDRVRVSVLDHGPGIPEAFHERIFQKFSQADGSSTRKQGGTGLGLAITRELIERMRGSINFFSEEGHGACFFFELPCTAMLAPPVDAPREAPADVADVLEVAPGSRLLIVEDDPDTALLLATLVRLWGYQAEVAHTLDEAVNWLERRSFDALTLDLLLPDGNGLTLLQQLRDRPQTQDLPVLVVSARADEGRLEIGGELRAVDWLSKPFDERRLALALASSQQLQPQRERVMHVGDDAELARHVGAQIAQSMTLDVAHSLQEARYLLDSNDYGLISLDLTATRGPGWEIIPLLSQLATQPAVIILSDQALAPNLLGRVETAIAKPGLSSEALREAFDRQLREHGPNQNSATDGDH
ncbi:ATP-binding protein [Salinicola avicenniae]|uniref:ATP-binding protein n=1 Tax=Salinicola avicenniae TaxID=2916836 RepID=UPI0020733757|nr:MULTISPECIES: ATP-binding protein [unclassified Salinicola]